MEENNSLFEFEVDQPISKEMSEMARSAKAFGLIIVIMLGLLVLFMFAAWSQLEGQFTDLPEGERSMALVLGMIVLLLVAAILGTMMFFLIRGANRLRKALNIKEQSIFNAGLGDIKVFFVFYGVLSILGLLSTISELFK
jgi:uncharacterized integral membrane protein